MIVHVTARWIVPVVSPTVRDGWIEVDSARGTIVGLGSGSVASGRAGQTLDLGDAVILPGLVNAHTHLELSHLAGVVPPAASFVAWVRALLQARRARGVGTDETRAAAGAAIASMEATGTVAVGDVGNSNAAVQPLAASSLSGVHFREALGFRTAAAARIAASTRSDAIDAAEDLRAAGHTRLAISIAPHAPYSTSAALVQALQAGLPGAGGVSTIHVGESPEEVEFLATGTGPCRALLEDLGAWDDTWSPPRLPPVDYLQSIGALHRGMLVVHGTQCRDAELTLVRAAGATLVLCARSNRWVGVGDPPVSRVFASGVRAAVGTDSLASVDDLNLFAELAHLQALAPDLPAPALLRAATTGGADALGCGALGRLAPGASWRALVRRPPSDVADVEQWLVADAASTGDVRWLDQLVADAARRTHPGIHGAD